MSNTYDRREFLRKGAKGAAAAAALGGAGGLLEACGSSSAKGGSTTTSTTLGPSGVKDFKKVKPGGSLTMGTWSEDNSLSPPNAQWDSTGYLYGNAIFDTLIQIGADGLPHPYLCRSFSHNPDYTVWTFKLRPGIEFHNGEPLNAAAVVNSLEAVRGGIVTSKTLAPVTSITDTDSMTVTITVDRPWPAFPTYLAGQVGYICAPAMLKETDEGGLKPIGTGPFVFEIWDPGNHLTVTKNPRYWQQGYPYLDTLTFKPLADNTERAQALESGTVQLIHSQAPQTIKTFFAQSAYQVILGELPPRAEPTVDFVMLNLDVPPLNDPLIRKALALAIDSSTLRDTYGADLTELVKGPFVPGEIWYAPTGYPSYDPKQAAALVAEYKKKTGTSPTIKLTTITGPQYLETASIIQAGWNAAGIETTVGQIEQAQFITDAVVGSYQACTFEQFGATDPDQNYIWWSTDTYAKVGAISLNMARNQDARIQQALNVGRSSTDTSERVDAYQKVAKYLAEDLPYLWLAETYWAAIADDDVVGITGQVLPDGSKSIGFNTGSFLVHQLGYTN